ncbi:hypothetical protein B566_EDAN007798 [Ephemera danica]|nr:hypothetical protein B566_EDAN007798 [Ephemera danica]
MRDGRMALVLLGVLCISREVLSSQWTHSVTLLARTHLSWTYDDKSISFQIEAPTRGYVGLGFSPNGGMTGADIVIGWVDDDAGDPHLAVSHSFIEFYHSK